MASCPPATRSLELNLKNRQKAIDVARYGPMAPEHTNREFWAQKAQMWRTSPEEAKTCLCSNCAAFIQTKQMLNCIEEGLGDEPGNASLQIRRRANLGYCELFDFKCAGDRTCDAWITGGPITSDR